MQMASKEEGIQRCKAIIAHYQSLEKKEIAYRFQETVRQIVETLHLFPKTKEDDPLYPVEELLDMYKDFNSLFRFALDSHARLEGPSLVCLFFGYFERNGPGTPYLKALSLFVSVASESQALKSRDDIDETYSSEIY